MKRFRFVTIVLLWGLASHALQKGIAAEPPASRIILNHATIVADPRQPSYVQFAVEELAGYHCAGASRRCSAAAMSASAIRRVQSYSIALRSSNGCG